MSVGNSADPLGQVEQRAASTVRGMGTLAHLLVVAALGDVALAFCTVST